MYHKGVEEYSLYAQKSIFTKYEVMIIKMFPKQHLLLSTLHVQQYGILNTIDSSKFSPRVVT